jgi:hypothetical protein
MNIKRSKPISLVADDNEENPFEKNTEDESLRICKFGEENDDTFEIKLDNDGDESLQLEDLEALKKEAFEMDLKENIRKSTIKY